MADRLLAQISGSSSNVTSFGGMLYIYGHHIRHPPQTVMARLAYIICRLMR